MLIFATVIAFQPQKPRCVDNCVSHDPLGVDGVPCAAMYRVPLMPWIPTFSIALNAVLAAFLMPEIWPGIILWTGAGTQPYATNNNTSTPNHNSCQSLFTCSETCRTDPVLPLRLLLLRLLRLRGGHTREDQTPGASPRLRRFHPRAEPQEAAEGLAAPPHPRGYHPHRQVTRG